MLGKGKKIVSVAYKEKLLAEIAHYEKRIDEALNKRDTKSFENASSDDELNPYTLKNQQSWFELKQQEASLNGRASMTLELALLTIMQSEVNVMVTPPEVRRPVQEDGIWLDVAAECKIDLVSFDITFYAHKPHRRFAPTRYRHLVVELAKPPHQKELAQSVLPKLRQPHLALQVLQSYATAFRSRRTTLLELAEKYADRLRMDALPEGGYRVKFLNLLQVDWTLENMWSPIVPFCHRMKFEVEYMPKDYIHSIGKLYKQFKDPSLETHERTRVLSKIFDTCLEAQGLAREIQESFESDPETANILLSKDPSLKTSERTMVHCKIIDTCLAQGLAREIQESFESDPEIANSKDPSLETSGTQSRLPLSKFDTCLEADLETTSRLHERRTTIDQEPDVPNVEHSPQKPKGKENKAQNRKTSMAPPKTIPKKAKKGNANRTNERKSVKRAVEDDATNDAKKSRIYEENVDNSKSKAGLKGGKDGIEGKDGEIEVNETSKTHIQKRNAGRPTAANNVVAVTSKNDREKKDSSEVVNNSKETDKMSKVADAKKKEDGKSDTSKRASEASGDIRNGNKKRNAGIMAASADIDIESREVILKKKSKKGDDKSTDSKDTTRTVPRLKKLANKDGTKYDANKATTAEDKQGGVTRSKETTKSKDGNIVATSKNKNIMDNVATSKNKTKKGDGIAPETKSTNTIGVKDIDTASSSKPVARNNNDAKVNTVPKTLKSKNDYLLKKVSKHVDKQANVAKTIEVQKDDNIAKTKEIVSVASNKTDKDNNRDQGKKLKETSQATGKGKDIKEPTEQSKEMQVKPTENKVKTKNKKSVQVEASSQEKKKTTNTKPAEQKADQDKNRVTADIASKSKVSAQKTTKNNEVLAQKTTTSHSDSVNTKNKDQQAKKPTDTSETKNIHKPTGNATRNILKGKPNRDDVNMKNKISIQNEKAKSNEQETKNLLNVTVTKPKTIPTLKSQENQIKIADKLKTKIPMMKKKMTFSSLRDKFVDNVAKISKVEKPRAAAKLPVFKKVVKNLPTRISPRKVPSTFKPSSRGFSNN